MTGTKHRGLAPHKITPMLGVLATEPGLRDSRKWIVNRPGSLNPAVPRLAFAPMIDVDAQPRIVAEIVMLSSAEGGRTRGILIDRDSRYMPHLAIDDRSNRRARTDSKNQSLEHCMGVQFEPPLSVADAATGSGQYPLRLMCYPRVDYSTLHTGATFTVREGGRIVGHGVVVSSNLPAQHEPSGEQ